MTPHKCPCCDGYGKRAEGPCLSCAGTGIVWGFALPVAWTPLPIAPPSYPDVVWSGETLPPTYLLTSSMAAPADPVAMAHS